MAAAAASMSGCGGRVELPDAYAAAALFATSSLPLPWLTTDAPRGRGYPTVLPPAASSAGSLGAFGESLGAFAAISAAASAVAPQGGGLSAGSRSFARGLFGASSSSQATAAPAPIVAAPTRSLAATAAQAPPKEGALAELLAGSPAALATARAPPPKSEVLRVRVLAAYNLRNRDTGLFGDVSDPYVVLRLGQAEFRTATIDDDLNPVWSGRSDACFEFAFSLEDGPLRLQVMNENVAMDTSLGWTTIDVSAVLHLSDGIGTGERGRWRRLRLPLAEGGRGELEVEIRLDGTPSSELADRLFAVASATSSSPQTQAPSRKPVTHPARQPPLRSARTRECASTSLRVGLPENLAWDHNLDESTSSASGTIRSRCRSDSLTRSPRNRCFAAPQDLFEAPRLSLPDADVLHPAVVAASSAVSSQGTGLDSAQHNCHVRALAHLHDALRLGSCRAKAGLVDGTSGSARQSVSTSDMQNDAEDAAVAEASEREKRTKTSADAELSKALQRLKALAPAASETAKRRSDAVDGTSFSQIAPKASGPAPSVASKAPAPALVDAKPFAAPAVAPSPATASASIGLASAAATSSLAKPVATPFAAVTKAPSVATPPAAPAAPSADSAASAAKSSPASNVKRLTDVEEQLKAFRANDANKPFRNTTKKRINSKVAQISSSVKQIRDCAQVLGDVLREAGQESDKQKLTFAELTLADRLFDDAETLIRNHSNGRAAWPTAYVATQVFATAQAAKDLFSGYMYRSCPYLVPDYIGSSISARKAGAYPGQRPQEACAAFLSRMVGYGRLWFATLVLGDELPTLWKWLASTLNAEPSAVALALLVSCVEMTGSSAHQRYGKQFAKLMKYVEQVYLPLLEGERERCSGDEADRFRADLSRLRQLVTDFSRKGRCAEPEGREISVAQEAELNPDI
eukprot:TRINITY_DN11503_c1_g5_i1.p1 TRINITY_DN11503_c1_g5~~TRINITY_DN11503_c1_g5_i1.p1  ORF type:complete len:919 (+),score=200.87 TRINITY_DN11503_c1_g5_i1:56-2812(+)